MEIENLIEITQFCTHHSIDHTFIYALDEHGIIELISIDGMNYLHVDSIEKTEKMIRLHVDLSINIEGIDVIIQLLEKIEQLEIELAFTKKKLEFLTD